MSGWDDVVNAHPAKASLDAIRTRVSELGGSGDPQVQVFVDRLTAVLRHAHTLLQNAQPDLVSVSSLDALEAQFQQIALQLDAYSTDEGTITNLETAARTTGSTILEVSASLASAQPYSPEGVSEASASYKQALDQLINDARGRIGELTASIDETKKTIESTRESFSADVTAAENSLATQGTALKQNLDAITTEVQGQKTRLDTMINQHSEQFATEQAARQKEFATLVESKSQEFKTTLDESVARGEADLAEAHKQASTRVKAIADLQDDSERLAELIARATTGGGFQEYADDQKWRADKWSIASIVILIGLGIAAAFVLSGDSATVDIRRSVFVFPLLLASAYAAKQAGHHRANERRSRQFELETVALRPYIARLPQDQQEAIMAYMALRVFGHFDPADDTQSRITPEGVDDLLSAFRNRAKSNDVET